jgi:hypothetical protein
MFGACFTYARLMSAHSRISRKAFLVGLGLVTVGVGLGCGGSDSESDDGTGGGSGSSGAGGGQGGSGQGGSGQGGASGGSGGSGASGGSATGGSAGTSGGGSAGAGGANPGSCTAAITALIYANHDHELTIPLSDIQAGVEKEYETTGSATHCHRVTLTAADFATLASGGVVTKTSCSGTNHQYVLSCGTPPAPVSPDCNGTPNLGACN